MKRQPRRNILILAIIISITLYGVGVISGLYVTKVLEERTASSISSIQNQTDKSIIDIAGTKQQVTELRNYIGFLDTNLKSMQLQQSFLTTVNETDACRANSISTSFMIDQLQNYRDRLPFRLEQYERDNQLSDEYKELKRQYNILSIQTWIVSRNQERTCGNMTSVLYFYSSTCDNCVAQGEALDNYTATMRKNGKNVVVFAIDYGSDDPTISFVKRYYGINSVPAIIIDNTVYQGRLFATKELIS